MNIQVVVILPHGESSSGLPHPAEIADLVLKALDGNPLKDSCYVTIQDLGAVGVNTPSGGMPATAGKQPFTPPPPATATPSA